MMEKVSTQDRLLDICDDEDPSEGAAEGQG